MTKNFKKNFNVLNISKKCQYQCQCQYLLISAISAILLAISAIIHPSTALAQSPAFGDSQLAYHDTSQPIEIEADSLEVLQNKRKAIFSGKVSAKQGGIVMRSGEMIVFYAMPEDNQKKSQHNKPKAEANAINKIIARGEVIFSSAEETAQGDYALYDVANSLITLSGNVLLTKGQNVLKGNRLEYNMATGKSMITNQSASGESGKPQGRVRGVFIPNQ